MRKCPKCSRQYDDPVRICRTCGSFLEAIAEGSVEEEEKSATPPATDESLPVFTPTAEERGENSETPPDMDELPLSIERSWQCPQCHNLSRIPSTFAGTAERIETEPPIRISSRSRRIFPVTEPRSLRRRNRPASWPSVPEVRVIQNHSESHGA